MRAENVHKPLSMQICKMTVRGEVDLMGERVGVREGKGVREGVAQRLFCGVGFT